MNATIKDVSREASVSVAAVSLVLNNKPCRISEEKKALIKKVAQELDYQPNRNAVALITKRTMKIGTIVYDIGNAFFAEFAKGVESMAADHGYGMLLVNMHNRTRKHKDYAEILGYSSIDGLVVASNIDDPALEKYVTSYHNFSKPVAIASNGENQIHGGNIIFRNNEGSYLATKHLLELGHRKIACITGPVSTFKDRLFGYTKALQEYGLEYEEKMVATGDYLMESGYLLSKQLVDKGATAIFAFNDLMAYGVYRMAEENNIRIPQDLSVVGFDDLMYSSLMSTPLTTVQQPSYAMGEETCKMVIGMIESKKLSADDVYFNPKLIIRKSTRTLEK